MFLFLLKKLPFDNSQKTTYSTLHKQLIMSSKPLEIERLSEKEILGFTLDLSFQELKYTKQDFERINHLVDLLNNLHSIISPKIEEIRNLMKKNLSFEINSLRKIEPIPQEASQIEDTIDNIAKEILLEGGSKTEIDFIKKILPNKSIAILEGRY